ncbi:MAG: hypothetical protein JW870_11125 [Candidatus Delongbacteria bacterium]|nr:hypothetical protein [Candidatus Delongbacteria bacterium]
MSNGSYGYVDKSYVLAQINDLQSILENRIKSVDNNLRGLEDKFNNFKQDVSSYMKKTDNRLEKMEDNIVQLNNTLSNLMKLIVTEFKSFNDKLGELNIITEQGNKTINQNLKKVSSGVALVEVLQGKFESGESDYKIERAIEEIESRYIQAEKFIEKEQKVWDFHFSRIITGYEDQLKKIASHIYEIKKKSFSLLDKMHSELEDNITIGKIIQKVQDERTDDRTILIKEEFEKLDLSQLKRFSELRNKLEEFINNEESIRIEGLAEDSLQEESLLPLSIPVNFVQTKSLSQNDLIDFYCLECEVTDCYSDIDIHEDYVKLYENIIQLDKRLDLDDGQEFDEDYKKELVEIMQKFVEKGLLKHDHLDLIKTHLQLYPLKQMKLG